MSPTQPLLKALNPLDDSIHWGKSISGLRLGAKFRRGNNSFAVGDVVEADLWIANVTDQPIECSIRLPHPMDGWLFNVVNNLGNNIMLERPPLVLIFSPQEFYSLKLAPGEVKALTGDRVEGQPSTFAGRRAKFEIASKKEAKSSEDYTIKGRLVTQSGNYSAIYSVMLERPDIPGLRVELDTAMFPSQLVKHLLIPKPLVYSMKPLTNRFSGASLWVVYDLAFGNRSLLAGAPCCDMANTLNTKSGSRTKLMKL